MSALKVTRQSPGNYRVQAQGASRVWIVAHNPLLGSTPWVAYVEGDRDSVLDPLWTKRETLECIAEIEAREKN